MSDWRSQVERLERLDTCAISDSLDQLKLNGAVIGIRPMWPCPKIAGRAVTVKIAPGGLTRPEHHLATPAVESAEAGDIIVIDNAGRTDVSCWGDILANASQTKGIRGVIIDGASRDIDGSRDIGFPVFARGAVPVTARGRIMQQDYNILIQCGTVQVRPGDLVLADGSGVTFLPQEHIDEILDTAEKIVAREAQMVEAVRSGRSVVEVMAESQFQAIHQEQYAH
jgi:4-hydroxy-4-methyl-2-oxoglutarate aldolase